MSVFRARTIVQSFHYALSGLAYALATQRNIRIHVAAAALALAAAIALGCTAGEVALVALAASLVLVAELVNTAIEAAVDLTTRTVQPLARIAKNVAAGAVFFAALNSLVVGVAILGPRVLGVVRALAARGVIHVGH